MTIKNNVKKTHTGERKELHTKLKKKHTQGNVEKD